MEKSTLQDRIEPSRAALLVVDVQNDFCHDDGALAARGIDLGPTKRMVPKLLSLIEAARGRGMPVLYTKNEHDAWTNAASWKQRQAGEGLAICRSGSWGAEFYEVAPTQDERVVVKHRYNSFLGTDLDMILRGRGAEAIIFTGVATNVCVESTARDAFARGYRLVMVEDCLAGSSEPEHAASLQSLERYFDATVVCAKALDEAWAAAGR